MKMALRPSAMPSLRTRRCAWGGHCTRKCKGRSMQIVLPLQHVCLLSPCICHDRSPTEVAPNRCDACDKPGCWRTHPECTFFTRALEQHVDALPGDTIPHMRQLEWRRLERRAISGGQLGWMNGMGWDRWDGMDWDGMGWNGMG